MPYNEWGDQDPKYEALKAYYESTQCGDTLSAYEASERLKEIEEAESWNNMGGS